MSKEANTSQRPKKRIALRTIVSIVFLVVLVGLIWIGTPADIRPATIEDGISQEEVDKGKALLKNVRTAYGDSIAWYDFETVSMVLFENWYGDTATSGWSTDPQKMTFTSYIGSNDAEMIMLNGKYKTLEFSVLDDVLYEYTPGHNKVKTNKPVYYEKLIYNNYWFQFPFRALESEIIAYGGTEEVDGKVYDLVFISWGTDAPQKEVDQFVVYINPDNNQIDYIHYTNRKKYIFIELTAQFLDFQTVNGIAVPHRQLITTGSPASLGMNIVERTYHDVEFHKR